MPGRSAPAFARPLVRAVLATYFRRIERFRLERIPQGVPLLLVANHPGSLIDAFVIGASLSRPVHFVAAVRLFRSRFAARLLARCGVIPVSRKTDDPSKAVTVGETFQRCFEVLDAGGVVGIFPEGLTYDDHRLKPIKTGAARLAVEMARRHDLKTDLVVVPIGLTYSAKERFRSTVLVHAGEPTHVASFLAEHDDRDTAAVRALTERIDRQIRGLIVDLPSLEHERVVAAVQRLYFERLRASNLIVTEPMTPDAETLVLVQAIGHALKHLERTEPDRLAAFVADLDRYERWLHRLGLSDRAVAPQPRRGAARAVRGAMMTAAAPIAVFGWVHHLAPATLVGWALRRFTPVEFRKSQSPLTMIVSGAVALGLCYTAYVSAAFVALGAGSAVLYACLLPSSGLLGHYYLRAMRERGGRLRTAAVLLQAPIARRSLQAMRARLVAAIATFRADYAEVLIPEIRDARALRQEEIRAASGASRPDG